MKKTSVFQNSLIWFGAGVSIAEILTGTYFAPLGMAKGFAAVLLGHLIGCTMMFFAGLIGGRTGLSAMETSKLSFGKKGSLWFAALNVLQLVGWTAIMIYDGALAANGIAGVGAWLWCLVIGALILVWILIGLTDLGRYRPDPAAGWPWSGRPADRGVLYRHHHLPGCLERRYLCRDHRPQVQGQAGRFDRDRHWHRGRDCFPHG